MVYCCTSKDSIKNAKGDSALDITLIEAAQDAEMV